MKKFVKILLVMLCLLCISGIMVSAEPISKYNEDIGNIIGPTKVQGSFNNSSVIITGALISLLTLGSVLAFIIGTIVFVVKQAKLSKNVQDEEERKAKSKKMVIKYIILIAICLLIFLAIPFINILTNMNRTIV